MKIHARRAFPAWAVPALVLLLAGAAMPAHAAEGIDAPTPARATTTQATTTQATTTQATLAQASPVEPATAEATPTVFVSMALPAPAVTPAPRPLATGPVWTDASGVWRQVGIASWYGGSRWQGRLTAAGVRYDERQLTAAHASLPLGSRVRVTVADSGRSVIVTINDRPGTRKRIIDLSRAAAEELGIVARGLARVTLTPA